MPNNWGFRADGTPKGSGWLGTLNRPDGGISTELTIGIELDGKKVDIPTLVPTLNQGEIDYLLNGGFPTEGIIKKAVDHALPLIIQWPFTLCAGELVNT